MAGTLDVAQIRLRNPDVGKSRSDNSTLRSLHSSNSNVRRHSGSSHRKEQLRLVAQGAQTIPLHHQELWRMPVWLSAVFPHDHQRQAQVAALTEHLIKERQTAKPLPAQQPKKSR